MPGSWPGTQKAAYRLAQDLVEYLRTETTHPHPTGPRLIDYARLFEEEATNPRATRLKAEGRPYSPATLRNYKDKIERYLAPDAAFSSLRIGEVTQELLLAHLGRVSDSLDGPCRSYQDYWVIMHMILGQYADDTPGFRSPFHYPHRLRKPSYDEEIRGALTEDEAIRIFESPFPDPLERAACVLAFWAGLRRGEVFALQWEDVDFVQRRLIINRAWKNFGYKDREVGSTKGRKTRIVPMVLYVEDALKALLGPGNDAAKHRGEAVIRKADGTTPSSVWWEEAIDHAFIRAGITAKARKITPHSSRHTIGSIMLARGVPVAVIREILGHFDERTTEGYLHIAAEEIDKATRRIEGERYAK